MPVVSGLTPHYEWTHADRRHDLDRAMWRAPTRAICDTSFSGELDDSFYTQHQHQHQQQQQQPWINTSTCLR